MSIANNNDNMALRLAFGTPDRLNKALTVADVSSQEMADYLGVSRNTISNYINGRTIAKKQTLRLWAMRTGVPLVWLEQGILPTDRGGMSKNQELRISGLITHMHRSTHQAA
jgi:transcriptional regulator with XRE-family HTH domain